MFVNRCENTGDARCQQDIASNCQRIFTPVGTEQPWKAWGYSQMSDCLNDPRQTPLRCQPNNLNIFCRAQQQVVGVNPAQPQSTFQGIEKCAQNEANLSQPLDVHAYHCAANRAVTSPQLYQQCMGTRYSDVTAPLSCMRALTPTQNPLPQAQGQNQMPSASASQPQPTTTQTMMQQ